MKRSRNGTQYVVCVANRGYRVSLVVRRLYRLIPDRDALQRGLLRIIDESGEDYTSERVPMGEKEIATGQGYDLAEVLEEAGAPPIRTTRKVTL